MPLRDVNCRLGRHMGPYRPVANGHIRFGSCPACRADLVMIMDGEWQAVPQGYQVVWRTRAEAEAVGTARNLPKNRIFTST